MNIQVKEDKGSSRSCSKSSLLLCLQVHFMSLIFHLPFAMNLSVKLFGGLKTLETSTPQIKLYAIIFG